jgi:hypothetical protein
MEDHRLAVIPGAILDYFQRVIESIDNVPAHFVFNADEMGYREWTDRHEQICFVPVFHPGDQFDYPVSRVGRQITVFAYIAADGSYAMPLVIIPRKLLTRTFG